MKSVALHNLGCKVNAYEMDVMQQMLLKSGYQIVPFDERADVYIINTCTVTNIADQKSRQMIHRARKRNPDAVVAAAGCYVQTKAEALDDPSIDLIIGNNRKKDIVTILEEFLEAREKSLRREPIPDGIMPDGSQQEKTLQSRTLIDINHTAEYEQMQLSGTGNHTRAYVKIQDGCNRFCSYCIIPYARGRARSRTESDILAEAGALAAAGYQEIVLTGIHLSSYGIDRGKSELPELLEKLNAMEGLKRIRLSSLEPGIVTPEFAKRLSALPKLCPHFHLSLQSGCDETLYRMNRHYTTREYLEKVEILRAHFDRPAITTDVIVGFPGETEEEFLCTEAFLEEVHFYEMHIFKYSKRQGTKAAAMENQIPDQKKSERSSRLIRLEQKMSKEYRASMLGTEAEVLFEEAKKLDGCEYQIGHTRQYVKVAKKTQEDLRNRILQGKISRFLTDDIVVMEQDRV